MIGIHKDGMYFVSDKGLVSSITKYLREWAGEIEDASLGTIRFVDDPDRADILISVRVLYKYYSSGGYSSKGYSNQLTFFAYDLSNQNNEVYIQKGRSPGRSVSLSDHPKNFSENPPAFENSDELDQFVTTIME